MYKRETRFKGQKRVSVGRMTRNNDPLESRSKDSSRESSCEDASRIVKCEPNLNDADIAISGVQVNVTCYYIPKGFCWQNTFYMITINFYYRSSKVLL